MNKKFTILTSSYNCGRYLLPLVDSVIAQCYRPIEAVMVDDHSNDNTKKLIDEISAKYKKASIEFKYIRNKTRLYCGSSYRVALKNATGYYLGVLDSDDMLEPFACSFVVGLYERYKKVTWLYTQYNKYNRTMERIIKKGYSTNPIGEDTLLSLSTRGIHNFSHWRTFSCRVPDRKSLFKGGLKCCVDKYLGYRLEKLGIGMFVDKVCYRYRTRNRGEKPISYEEPLQKVLREVITKVKKRRKNNKCNPYKILKHKL